MNTQATEILSFLDIKKETLVFLTKAILGSLLIAVAAQITVPSWPVPMTLQTTAITILGLTLSPRLAVASVIAYILEGSVGLPVFHAFKSGIPHLLNTTGGYLFGYIPMIYIISALKNRNQKITYQIGICLLGQVAMYAVGLSHLSLFVGWAVAVQTGLIPFLFKIPVGILFSLLSVNLLQRIKRS